MTAQSRRTAPKFTLTMVRQEQELRRSGASGAHGKRRPDRRNTNQRAIAASLRGE